MGDRRNVIVKHDAQDYGIALYTHWGGSDLLRDIAIALELGKSRWDDPGYFTRFLLGTMTNGQHGLTGFGIYPLQDGQSPTESTPGYDPIVDLDNQNVTVNGETLSFSEFLSRHIP